MIQLESDSLSQIYFHDCAFKLSYYKYIYNMYMYNIYVNVALHCLWATLYTPHIL